MTDSWDEIPREQNNYGPGAFIGRDNFGSINYEMIDKQTKASLGKMAETAPGLAILLAKALRDGVISPEIVAALESAVRNINEDVASALMFAGQNINEDVAVMLQGASNNINPEVANCILQAASSLSNVSSELDHTVEKLGDRNHYRNLADIADRITEASRQIELRFTPPEPELLVDRWGKFKAFIYGIVFAALVALIIYVTRH